MPPSAWCFLALFVCFLPSAQGQIDSLGGPGSASEEDLVEAGAQSDDSPILDDLPGAEESRHGIVSLRIRMGAALQPAAGFLDHRYRGSPVRSYERLKIRQGEHCSLALLLEKDPGEVAFNDFMTGNVTLTNIGFVSKLVLGDYVVEAGQGLGLWRGFEAAKGADVVRPVYRQGRGMTPYCSSGEDAFLRGAASEFRVDRVTISLFISRLQRSASLDTAGLISSFYSGGVFRTDAELEKKNNVTERLAGIRCVLEPASGSSVGATVYSSDYSRTLSLDRGLGFGGAGCKFGSLDYRIAATRVALFGEWGGNNGVIGGLSGIFLRPLDDAELVAAVRYYPAALVNLRGLPIGEWSRNETGAYVGFRLRYRDMVSLSTFYDRFASTTTTLDGFSSTGHELLVQADVTVSRRLAISLRYRLKSTEERRAVTAANGLTTTVTDPLRRRQGRLNIDYAYSRTVRLRARIDGSFSAGDVARPAERGFAFYQEVVLQPSPYLSANLRVTSFDAASREVGLYEVERDLPGVASMPLLIGTGIRWYLLLTYAPSPSIKFAVKYAELTRDDVRRIGSGFDLLPGNRDARLGIELDVTL